MTIFLSNDNVMKNLCLFVCFQIVLATLAMASGAPQYFIADTPEVQAAKAQFATLWNAAEAKAQTQTEAKAHWPNGPDPAAEAEGYGYGKNRGKRSAEAVAEDVSYHDYSRYQSGYGYVYGGYKLPAYPQLGQNFTILPHGIGK